MTKQLARSDGEDSGQIGSSKEQKGKKGGRRERGEEEISEGETIHSNQQKHGEEDERR